MTMPRTEDILDGMRREAGDNALLLAAIEVLAATPENHWIWWEGDGHFVTGWGFKPLGIIKAIVA